MVLTLIVVQALVVYYRNSILVFSVFLNLPVFLLVHSHTYLHVGNFPGTPSIENIQILRQTLDTPSSEAHA